MNTSRVVVALEHRFDRSPDGRVWTGWTFEQSYWERYLEVFDEVHVLARVQDVAGPPDNSLEATGAGIVFTGLPYYRGLGQFLRRRARIRALAIGAIRPGDAVILKVPSAIATLIAPGLRSRGIPYAVEVIGDPYDVFSPGAVRHPLRPLIRWKMTRDLKRQTREAAAAGYVTERALQQRYPCGRFEIGCSDVELSSEFLVPIRVPGPLDPPLVRNSSSVASRDVRAEPGSGAPPRIGDSGVFEWPSARAIRLISVGTFDQLYKGPDVLVDAVGICVKRGLDITLRFVGSGAYLAEIRRQAERIGIADRVCFDGHLSSRADLVARLDASDLFVLPSRTEGLPRAMIEAMARGLPCLGSKVGGIPELLDAEDMVPPGDAPALARTIEEVVSTPSRLGAMRRRSFERARGFVPERLAATRRAFYSHVLRSSRSVAGIRPPLVVHVTTVAMSLLFLRGQSRFMRERGFELEVISSPGSHQVEFAAGEQVRAHAVSMQRRITPVSDLVSVVRLMRVLLRTRPAIVHAHTPKGGLLGTIAATLCRVPVRIYDMHGLPMSTATGLRRLLLWLTERVSCSLAHEVICCSESLRQLAVAQRICRPSKTRVIANGSVGGVDASERFNPMRVSDEEVVAVRRRFGIAPDAVVIGFVGRMVSDKGIPELMAAWRSLREEFPAVHLLLVGPFEEVPLPVETQRSLESDPRVHLAGEDWNTPPLFAAMDVVCLPSYREGFPVVCLEAAAMGRPVVATRVTGCVDAVVDGVTGTLVPAADSMSLYHALRAYVVAPDLRSRHGAAGRARVLADYAPERIWAGLAEDYTQWLRVRRANATLYRRFGKRALDLVLAGGALIVCSPILLAVALAVGLSEGRPLVFRQSRPGYLGRPFRLFKFRTMREVRDAEGVALPDGHRLSALGGWLRATSLDELPELWNVLRGEMSLVGPRPLLLQYLNRYTQEQARRHDVRPGLTGLAQVAGRNRLTWERKFALDVEYVDRCSLMLDLRILALTVWQVLARKNITEPGHATAREFMGTHSG